MRRMMSVMVMPGLLVMVFFGCGKTNFLPTTPSEAIAFNGEKSAPETVSTATPVLSFAPAQVAIRVGDEITVEARVDNAVDLWGVAATVLFDNTRLRFIRAEEGVLLSAQNPTSFMNAVAGWGPNQLAVGLVSLGKVPGVTGHGTLFRVTFRAISSGQSELKFVETALFNSINENSSKQKMNFESRSATITIE